ncbi:MAG: nucleotidyltransferase family protein, partial [Myxococcota bacterium]|nr:nucleotidyltransferase family protein [Myxococcota bacterium]
RDAHRIISESGFTLDTRGTVESADLEEGLLHGGTEYRKMVDGEEIWFELQWRPVAGRWIRTDQEPAAADLLARSVPIEGSDVRLLAPVDNMIQVALHTAKHTYVRAPGLRLHTDVDRLTRYQPPSWTEVEAMANDLEIRTAVYFSLAMARALLGTPVPDAILDHLAPEPWRQRVVTRWLRRVDVFDPNGHKFSRPAMMAFVAMLYDNRRGLMASVFDTEPDKLGLRHLPRNLLRGTRRVADIVTRYQA